MDIEYFAWSPMQMDELRKRFDDVLGGDYSEFEEEIEHETDDGCDRAITAGYRSKVRETLLLKGRQVFWLAHRQLLFPFTTLYWSSILEQIFMPCVKRVC